MVVYLKREYVYVCAYRANPGRWHLGMAFAFYFFYFVFYFVIFSQSTGRLG